MFDLKIYDAQGVFINIFEIRRLKWILLKQFSSDMHFILNFFDL